MKYEDRHEILQRLIDATKAGKLTWQDEDEHGWYTAKLGGREIIFRQLFFEATNQIGADPAMFEFTMPGMSAKFALGTRGADLLFELLGAAFPDKWLSRETDFPARFLDENLSP